MSRIDIINLFEEYGISEKQFRTYFGLNDNIPKKIYAAIVHYKESDGILQIIKEMLSDEEIIEEIKKQPVPYEQTVFEGCEGMPEPPDGECDKMYKIVFIDGNMRDTYSGSTYIYQGEKYAAFDNSKPKLYKSKGTAERSAKKLVSSCSNITAEYEIIEV